MPGCHVMAFLAVRGLSLIFPWERKGNMCRVMPEAMGITTTRACAIQSQAGPDLGNVSSSTEGITQHEN
jgi:hypothetical protein